MADGAAVQAPTPKPGEVQIDKAALNSDDIGTIGNALTGLFPDEDSAPAAQEIQQESQEAQPADTGQEETPATSDTEDGHSGDAETRPTEPPASWTAEAKELFAKLPPELQQAVAKRESDREAFLTTQSQKATEEAKRLEAERQQVAQDRAQQVTLLQSVLYQLTPELQRFQGIDWDKLAAEKPAEWAVQRQAFESLQLRWNMAQQQIGNIQQTQRAEQEKQHTTYLQEQYKQLTTKVPEYADRAKLKAFQDDLVKYLPEVTAQEIAAIGDHRQLLIARDAMLYRKGEALRAQAKTKLVPSTPQKPVLKPVARQGTAREEADARQIGALHETLRKSGSTQAAADLLAATGIFGKA